MGISLDRRFEVLIEPYLMVQEWYARLKPLKKYEVSINSLLLP